MVATSSLPSFVRIGGCEYHVSETENLRYDGENSDKLYGLVRHTTLEIEIDSGSHPDVKVQALLHEVLHGLFHQTGHFDIEQEERIVQMLGCQLPRLLRENPQLTSLLLGKDV